MKKILLIITFFLLFSPSVAFAQGMMDWGNNSNASSSAVAATAQDQIRGKQIWEQLQAKKIQCKSLTNDNYELLGEYFMGQMIGDTERHALMNSMMQNMMGKNGEEQMHIVLGKRFSGCELNASTPQNMMDNGMMSMMMGGGMMGGGVNSMMGYGGWNNMMDGLGGFGLGWMFMILLWVLVILLIAALVKWMVSGGKTNSSGETTLEILKERYAKGAINKKEFEQMRKDLA